MQSEDIPENSAPLTSSPFAETLKGVKVGSPESPENPEAVTAAEGTRDQVEGVTEPASNANDSSESPEEVNEGLGFDEAMKLAGELKKGDHKGVRELMKLLTKEGMVRLVKRKDNTLGAAPIKEGQASPISIEESTKLAELVDSKIDRDKMKSGQQRLAEKKAANKKTVEESIVPLEGVLTKIETANDSNIYRLINILQKTGHLGKGEDRKKFTLAEGYQEVFDAMVAKMRTINKKRYEREKEVNSIIDKLADKETSNILFGYARHLDGKKFVELERTGSGKNDWKVVATKKEGSKRIVEALMERKSEIEQLEINEELSNF